MLELDTTRKALIEYSGSAEEWKPKHNLAMACIDLEELLAVGVRALQSIDAFHAEWQANVLSGDQSPDITVDQAIWDMYAWWLRPCSRVRKEIEFFQRQGFQVKNAVEFYEAYRLLKESRRGQSRPSVAFRGMNAEEVAFLVSSSR